jgi:peptidoglycan hydrolase CwlO-like protein
VPSALGVNALKRAAELSLESMRSTRHIKRFVAALTAVSALGGVAFVPVSQGDLQDQIAAQQSRASQLAQSIKSESANIAQTSGDVASARAELTSVEHKLSADLTELRTVQTQLMTARDHLAQLEARLRQASNDLSTNLRAEYEGGTPNLMTVILNSHGFTQLLNQVNFAQRISKQDAHIVGTTRTARKQVLGETLRLGNLEERDKSLTDSILAQRNQVASLETSLLDRQIAETQARANTRSKLAGVQSTEAALQQKLAALQAKLAKIRAARAAQARQTQEQATVQVNQQAGGLAIDTAGMVQAPADAPEAVKEMIDAGNAIATLPYIWGGGHGSFISPGYDCSGSVSYVLAAAGLLSAPEVSGDFESYGDPGAGQWVTIYATSGHVWMTIAGWRFDTVALQEDGSRWSQGGGEFAGFVVRHPPGL